VKRSILVLICASLLSAQSSPEFEVATVKFNKTGGGVEGRCHGVDSKYTPGEIGSAPPLGRCVITAARLSHMIGIAWGLPMALLKGVPDWASGGFERFNVEAKADDPAKTTEAQLLAMLQTLLIERFQLKFHRETVDRPGYALVVGKNGVRNMTPSKAEDVVTSFGDQFKPMPGRPATLTARKYTMARLAGDPLHRGAWAGPGQNRPGWRVRFHTQLGRGARADSGDRGPGTARVETGTAEGAGFAVRDRFGAEAVGGELIR